MIEFEENLLFFIFTFHFVLKFVIYNINNVQYIKYQLLLYNILIIKIIIIISCFFIIIFHLLSWSR